MSRVEEFKIRAWVCTLCMRMEPSPISHLSTICHFQTSPSSHILSTASPGKSVPEAVVSVEEELANLLKKKKKTIKNNKKPKKNEN